MVFSQKQFRNTYFHLICMPFRLRTQTVHSAVLFSHILTLHQRWEFWSLRISNRSVNSGKGRPVMGLIPWTSNCRLFQSNDYGTRRQSRPLNQAHAGGHLQNRHCSLKYYKDKNVILDIFKLSIFFNRIIMVESPAALKMSFLGGPENLFSGSLLRQDALMWNINRLLTWNHDKAFSKSISFIIEFQARAELPG